MIDFDIFTKIALQCGRFGQINCFLKALKSCPKSNKSAQSGHTACAQNSDPFYFDS